MKDADKIEVLKLAIQLSGGSKSTALVKSKYDELIKIIEIKKNVRG